MLQPDLFFAYGLSSGLAVAAGKKLQAEKSPWVNKYYLLTLGWLSAFYLPQIHYLLWRFPAWESMFAFKNYQDIPPWFVALYCVATLAAGSAGFYLTQRLLRQGHTAAALAQVGWALAAATAVVFVGWDGTGYQRLLYTGTGDEWAAGVVYPWTAWFKSPIFYTLLWLEALVLLPYNALFLRWMRGK